MSRELAVLTTLIVYKLALLGIGLWASRRTRDNDDFFLGGRRMGALVAAISASASSSSAWTLLGVSGAAYLWGLSALWLFPATLSGFLVNWLWVAPRLMPASRRQRALTLTEFLVAGAGPRMRRALIALASFIILFSFLFYIAAQFQAAGDAFASTFALPLRGSIVLGAGVILLYTILGGFWAVSVTDTLQGLLMALTAVLLPVSALLAVGGFGGLASGLEQVGTAAELDLFGGRAAPAALGFVLGTLGIGLGYPGQPHVVNRFMALRDDQALRRARLIALGWAAVVYAGMLLAGLCARVLVAGVARNEQIFFVLTNELFPPVLAGVMIASVLSAIMSTADSQLLVAASAVAHDWRGRHASPLWMSRITVLVLSVVAVLVAIAVPATIFTRVLFAWHAVGSAFGPLLVLRLAGFQVRPGAALAAMSTGFALTVFLHALPDTPGDYLERLLPLLLAFAIGLAGRQPRRALSRA